MVCQLCDVEIEVEKENSLKEAEDITESDYVHNIAGFAVCLTCKEKVLAFFRNLVKE